VLAITRQPQLLVKMPAGINQAGLSFGRADLNFHVVPLLTSIGATGGLGAVAGAQWHLVSAAAPGDELNAWDVCHHLVTQGFGVAGAPPVEFAEPDLEQRWIYATEVQHAMALAKSCDHPADPDASLPSGQGFFWFRDPQHSQIEQARTDVGQPADRVRIAHFDTGFDPEHVTRPQFLRTDLQKNFVDSDFPNDATDRTSGLLTNLGHGTGTLSILAGASVDGVALGGAAFLDVIPVRVANSVVLFKNSAIASAFDYVHRLWTSGVRVHVITMSMGGLASQAWAEAVNALYDLGVFIVTAAGNNFGNLPTHNIVYPARFKRVVAACGVMADGRPYADLPLTVMAGNYGPASKMATAIAGFTPNTPWARLGCEQTVDHDGRGTSAATPQVASTAALWIQKFKPQWEAYSQGWMRVEAVRDALFGSARLNSAVLGARLGRGMVQAEQAIGRAPVAEAGLAGRKQPEDSASFTFLRVLTGLGAAAPDARHRMLELEALQLTQQSHELEELLPDPEIDPGQVSAAQRRQFVEALIATPGASQALRDALGAPGTSVSRPPAAAPAHLSERDRQRLRRAMDPPMAAPAKRRLRVYAYDPLLATRPDTVGLNETTLEVTWEPDLEPGPIGEYLQVVDVDPASGVGYAPVDLNHPLPLSQSGLAPSEGTPHFHQQMAYAVAMKTIEHFERALGRVSLWSPRLVQSGKHYEEHYVRRLRIYPHALREANSFYSPDKKALLFGYFPASKSAPGENLPGGTVFCCLSHDIVAHETTHALLDGLHQRFREPTNPDVLAFHEAFADIVALFQHFTLPEALRDQIARTQGDLGRQNILGELAQQFGQAIGHYGALRSAIGKVEDGQWKPAQPKPTDYQNATEAHDRGAVLVAAVFNAFLDIYKARGADLVRLATGGTGVLPEGAIPHDLVNRLAQEASKTAAQVLNMCIRALDYCPPVDITFGEYLRALITADRDLVPDDTRSYRAAFIQAFRSRGIYPEGVRNLSVESLCWEHPQVELKLEAILGQMALGWDLSVGRRLAFDSSRDNAFRLHQWLKHEAAEDAARELGFYSSEEGQLEVDGMAGQLRPFEVHSVRPVRRVGPDGQQRLDVVVEITQSWVRSDGAKFRGGCTLIIDRDSQSIRYCVRKRVAHPDRVAQQQNFQLSMAGSTLRANYFDPAAAGREPFAMMHRAE
jgi:Subtilase family